MKYIVILSDTITAHIKNARMYSPRYLIIDSRKICIIFLGAMALDRGS